MGNIVILDEATANKISAGEVIERPESVVKELIENSIDAGATSISVDIENGGISLIKVTDNGSGISEDDVEIAFERHATSKIRKSTDLENITSLGFRGEALASIASISKIQLNTKTNKNTYGISTEVIGGTVASIKQIGCPVGTSIIVRDLFYNTPARYKFLKKNTTEAGYISNIVSRIAIGNPHISFRLTNNKSVVINTPGNNDLQSTLYSIYGREISNNVIEIDYSDEMVSISGYAGKPQISRGNRNHQSVYINGRYIKSKIITSAIDEAYKTMLMRNRYAFIVINIKINAFLTDVNVHPAKMEVRFSNEKDIFRSTYHAIVSALSMQPREKNGKYDIKNSQAFLINNKNIKEVEYKQQLINMKKNNDKTDSTYISQEQSMEKSNIPDDITASKINEQLMSGKHHDNKKMTEWFLDAKIIGQAFSTYIILQNGNELVFIDQHAAHERIIFENLREKYNKMENMSQLLITPVTIELTNQEIEFLNLKHEILNKLGYTFESFGSSTILIRSVPYAQDDDTVKQTFVEILDSTMDGVDSNSLAFVEKALYTVACKASIKANKKLDEKEIINLMLQLSKLENPYTCPHGRPTIIYMGKNELEKRFKRKT